jgi:pyruvate formate lyase activating enzyme
MRAGIVFDIQHYCLHDGPGIRTVVFLKGCPLRCVWCQNPESQRLKPEIGYLKDKCVGCGKCAEICPEKAIILADKLICRKLLTKIKKIISFRYLINQQLNSLTAHRLIRNKTLCTACGKCASVCGTGATQLIGKDIRADDVIESVIKDKLFYENSGGGVTFSGGEPTSQKYFLFELLKLSKKNGLHTAIETCGCFDERLIDRLINYADLFLFDIKHIDSQRHKQFTGADNKIILQNFTSLYKKAGHERVTARIPLIPGFNADAASINMFVSFFKRTGFKGDINLMTYNPLYKIKFEKLCRLDEYIAMEELSTLQTESILEMFRNSGMNARIIK